MGLSFLCNSIAIGKKLKEFPSPSRGLGSSTEYRDKRLEYRISVPCSGLIFYRERSDGINKLKFPSPVRGLFFYLVKQSTLTSTRTTVSVPCFGLRFLLQDYVAQIRNLQRVSVPCSGLRFSKAWYDVKQGKEPQIFPSPSRGLFFQTNVNFWWQHYSKAFPSSARGLGFI